MYVRKSGGLSAVFRSSAYIKTPSGDVPIVPAGTIYYIGEIPPELIHQLSVLQEPLEIPSTIIIAEMATQQHSFIPKIKEAHHISFAFFEDEAYRRQRLTSFVLEIVLLN